MRSPVAPDVVGFEHALRQYRALADEARARRSGLRLRITGPAGIGKTTFLAVLANHIRGPKTWIAGGHTIGVKASDLTRVGARVKRRTIFLDDLHAADELTLDALGALVHFQRERIDVVCTDRRDEAPELGMHATIRLAPLRSSEAQQLAERIFTGADPEIIADIVRASGGLPFAITFLATQAQRTKRCQVRSATLSVDDALTQRVARSSETARDLVRICCVVDESLPVPVAAAAADVSAARVLEAASDIADLVMVDDMRIDFRHSLVREAARQAIMQPLSVFRRLLDAYGQGEDDLRDLRSIISCAIACGENTRVADTAKQAARIAVRGGALQTGLAFLEIALRYARRPVAAELAAEYADVLQRAVRHADAAEYLRNLLQYAIDDGDANRAIILLAPFASAALGLERFAELETLIHRISRIATDDNMQTRIRTILSANYAFSGCFEKFDNITPGSVWQDARAAAFASAVRGDARAAREHLESYQAHLAPRHAQLAVADRAMSGVIGLFLVGNGALETVHEHWADHGDRGGYPTGTALRVLHHFNAGRWDEAEAILDALPPYDPPAEEPLPIIDVRLMFSGVAQRTLQVPQRTLETIRAMIRRGQRRHAIGPASWYCVCSAPGAQAPMDIVHFARQMLGELPIPYMVASFPLSIALAAPILGHVACSAALKRNRRYESTWHRAHFDLAWGVLHEDHDALRRARDAFEALRCPALAMIAGLRLPVPRARDVAIARAIRFGHDNTEAKSAMLTARENDVSELAAAGASNREIARTLNIAERTVEVHLTAIYRKLQIRSRSALAARLLRRGATHSRGI